jgi:hypothetical protein
MNAFKCSMIYALMAKAGNDGSESGVADAPKPMSALDAVLARARERQEQEKADAAVALEAVKELEAQVKDLDLRKADVDKPYLEQVKNLVETIAALNQEKAELEKANKDQVVEILAQRNDLQAKIQLLKSTTGIKTTAVAAPTSNAGTSTRTSGVSAFIKEIVAADPALIELDTGDAIGRIWPQCAEKFAGTTVTEGSVRTAFSTIRSVERAKRGLGR